MQLIAAAEPGSQDVEAAAPERHPELASGPERQEEPEARFPSPQRASIIFDGYNLYIFGFWYFIAIFGDL